MPRPGVRSHPAGGNPLRTPAEPRTHPTCSGRRAGPGPRHPPRRDRNSWPARSRGVRSRSPTVGTINYAERAMRTGTNRPQSV